VTTKLHINLSQGVFDIEGDPELVREIYNDFRQQLLGGMNGLAQRHLSEPQPQLQPLDHQVLTMKEEPGPTVKSKRRPTAKKKASNNGDEGASGIIADSPKMDKSLNLAALPSFYEQFETANNAEKVLIFLKYLIDELEIDHPNTDQIYTCFERVNARIPKVFSQTFRDASGRRFGYIDYDGPSNIRVTTHGNNHFKFDLKRKSAE